MEEERLKELFKKLSQPLECGIFDSNGIRRQKSKDGEWSSERIFIFSDEIHKENPKIAYRSYFDSDGSWKNAIKLYLNSNRCFQHPKLKIYCLQEDIITYRNLDFDLNFIKNEQKGI